MGSAAAAPLVALVTAGYLLSASNLDSQIADLQTDIAAKKKQLDAYADVEKRLDAVHNWANTEMVLLDELYDLVARFPDASGLRITKAEWTSTPASAAAATP